MSQIKTHPKKKEKKEMSQNQLIFIVTTQSTFLHVS